MVCMKELTGCPALFLHGKGIDGYFVCNSGFVHAAPLQGAGATHRLCFLFLAGTDICVQNFVAANASSVNTEENAICVV